MPTRAAPGHQVVRLVLRFPEEGHVRLVPATVAVAVALLRVSSPAVSGVPGALVIPLRIRLVVACVSALAVQESGLIIRYQAITVPPLLVD